jgi:hypothetical protein
MSSTRDAALRAIARATKGAPEPVPRARRLRQRQAPDGGGAPPAEEPRRLRQRQSRIDEEALGVQVAAARARRRLRQRAPGTEQKPPAGPQAGALYSGTIKFVYKYRVADSDVEGVKVGNATYNSAAPPTPAEVKRAIDEFLEWKRNSSEVAWIAEADPPRRWVNVERVDKSPLDVRKERARDAGAPLMPHLGDDGYDTGRGCCVVDYFVHFNKMNSRKSSALRSEEDICLGLAGKLGDFGTVLRVPERRELVRDLGVKSFIEYLRTEGVTAGEIAQLCNSLGVTFYLCDVEGHLIQAYAPTRRDPNANRSVFGCIHNGHFYPVDARHKSISNVARAMAGNQVSKWRRQRREERADAAEASRARVVVHEAVEDPTCLMLRQALAHRGARGRLTFPHDIRLDQDGHVGFFKIGRTEAHVVNKDCRAAEALLAALKLEGAGVTSLVAAVRAFKEDRLKGLLKSRPNTQVDAVLRTPGVKDRAHLGMLDGRYREAQLTKLLARAETACEPDAEVAYGMDMCKAYPSALCEPLDDFPVIDYMDRVAAYEDDLEEEDFPFGLCVARTDDYTMLHGDNVYTSAFLRLARREGIAFRVTHVIAASRALPRDAFRAPVVELVEAATGPEVEAMYERALVRAITDHDDPRAACRDLEPGAVAKKALVAFYGLLAVDVLRLPPRMMLTYNNADIWRHMQAKGVLSNPAVHTMHVQDLFGPESLYPNLRTAFGRKSLYMCGVESHWPLAQHHVPATLAMHDAHNHAMYKLAWAMGGRPLYRKVDMIIVKTRRDGVLSSVDVGGERTPLAREDMAPAARALLGQLGRCKRVRSSDVRHLSELSSRDAFDLRELVMPAWDTAEGLVDSDQAADIVALAKERGGLCITGPGGVGKSYVARAFVEAYGEAAVLCAALTNTATNVLGGVTLASLGGWNKSAAELRAHGPATRAHMAGKSVVIVDEFSMVGPAELGLVADLKRSYPDVIFVPMGDDMQLRHPTLTADADVFNHPDTLWLAAGTRVDLRVNHRIVCPVLAGILARLRNKGLSERERVIRDLSPFGQDPWSTRVHITVGVRDMCYVNARVMDMHRPADAPMVPANLQYETSIDTYVYAGLPLMSSVNAKDGSTQNQERFVVTRVEGGVFAVRRREARPGWDADAELEFKLGQVQSRFVVNYASTAFKTQSITVREPMTVWDLPRMREARLTYTALSRAAVPIAQVHAGRLPELPWDTRFERNVQRKLEAYRSADRKEGRTPATVTVADVLGMYEAQGGHCYYCAVQLKTKDYKAGDDDQFSVDRECDAQGHCLATNRLIMSCKACNVAHRNKRLGAQSLSEEDTGDQSED